MSFRCNLPRCAAGFGTSQELRQHKINHPIIKCCNKVFTSVNAYYGHTSAHPINPSTGKKEMPKQTAKKTVAPENCYTGTKHVRFDI